MSLKEAEKEMLRDKRQTEVRRGKLQEENGPQGQISQHSGKMGIGEDMFCNWKVNNDFAMNSFH